MAGVRFNHNQQKLNILESVLKRQGWDKPDLRFRDVAKALGPGVVLHLVAPGVEHAVHHFVNHVAGGGATEWTVNHIGATTSQAIHHFGSVLVVLSMGRITDHRCWAYCDRVSH
jgi:hypothetical protein